MTEEELEALNDSGRLSHKRYYKECMRRHIEEQTELYKNKRIDTSHYSFFWILLSGRIKFQNDPDQEPEKFKKEVLERAISYLTDKQKEVVRLRLGIGTERPLKNSEIALYLNCSRSNVSKIERAAYKKISKIMNEKGRHIFFAEAKEKI